MKRRLFTYSEIATWRTCPQLHHFRYRDKLRPASVSLATRIGSLYHQGVEAGVLEGYRCKANGADAGECVAQASAAGRARSRAALGESMAEIERLAANGDALEAARVEAAEAAPVLDWMIGHYFEATADDFEYLVPVIVEGAFELPVARRDGRGGPLWHGGVLDLVFFDRNQGDLVVDDHKTVDVAPWGVERRIELDPQLAGYIAGLRELQRRGRLAPVVPLTVSEGALRAAQTGRVRYSVMRRATPREPKINQDGTVSTAAIDTTAAKYREACAAQRLPPWLESGRALGAEATPKELERARAAEERWAELLEKQQRIFEALASKGDPYFARFEFWRTDAEIERWRREFYVDAARIRAADRDPDLRTRNPGACTMAWSPACAYRSVCLDPDSPEVRGLYRVAEGEHEEIERAKRGTET